MEWSAVDTATIDRDNGDGTYDIKVYGSEGSDIREIIFATMAEERISVLMLRPLTSGLEEVFLQIVNGTIDNEEVEEELNIAFAEGGQEIEDNKEADN